MFDPKTITVKDFRERAIAIDTEYHADPYVGNIDRVYCVCAQDVHGHTYRKWVDVSGNSSEILREIADLFEISDPIFVAHAYDLAERQAFLHLGANPYAYDWLCTFHIARLVSNAFVYPKKGFSLSLVKLCRKFLGIEIDSEYKEKMRGYCIEGTVEGHEAEIMQYCLEDTAHLIPLAEKLVLLYERQLSKAHVIMGELLSKSPLGLLMWQCSLYNVFGRFADEGFPVNRDRVENMKKGASSMTERMYREFSEKYPGTYWRETKKLTALEEAIGSDKYEALKRGENVENVEKEIDEYFSDNDKTKKTATRELAKIQASLLKAVAKGKQKKLCRNANPWHRKDEAVQTFLKAALMETGSLAAYPKTAKGKLKTDTETLADWFRGRGGFGDELYRLNREMSQIKGVSNDWVKTLEGNRLKYRTLRPYASATGRCQGKTSDGFILGWSHFLYGILEPPEGWWLVELDFSAEETAIQAAICKDPAYESAYNQKDLYLWIGSMIGLIPKEDYDELSVHDLKAKYKTIRGTLKTFVLAWGYGCGAEKLAAKAGISLDKAKQIKDKLNYNLFKVSYQWKQDLQTQFFKTIEDASKGRRWNSKKKSFVALPDGWLCRVSYCDDEKPKSAVSLLNWPFQGYGALILRVVSKRIYLDLMGKVRPVATMHDAILFMVREGDNDAIESVRRVMGGTANALLGRRDFLRIGEPEIVRHGEVWTPEPENTEKFLQLMREAEGTGVVAQGDCGALVEDTDSIIEFDDQGNTMLETDPD